MGINTIRVGVDAGGTFTDVVVLDEQGAQLHQLKLPSRSDDPAAVVREALERLALSNEKIELVYSTTAATNAVLERRGGPTLLVTTSGFEDVLEIGRQTRPELYALEPHKALPLLPVERRLGLVERVAFDGQVLTPLDEDELTRLCALIDERAGGNEATTVAVVLLHGHAHPAHEQRVAARLRERGYRVSVSSEVCPLPREFERTSTTVLDAYVTPVLGATLSRLRSTQIALRVMESSGGARIGVRPARTVLSGPAAGVIAVEALARRHRLDRVVALDMGGTSTDLALIVDGAAARVEELSLDGIPVALPSVAVRSVGAGGGSIAWVDPGGALKIGPRSAGAAPGPAAYGMGGTEPTVTDAHVVIGRLGSAICGGAVALDRARAREAVATLANTLGTSVEGAAEAIVAVANASLARAVRSVCLGQSPAQLALVSYGGAAGLHVVEVARTVGIPLVLVPPSPGLQCAFGALQADVVVEELASCQAPLDGPLSDALAATLDALAARVDANLATEGVPRSARRFARSLRARYVGQGIDAELELGLDDARRLDREVFHRTHEAAYGYRLEREIEIVRLAVRGSTTRPDAMPVMRAEVGWPRHGRRTIGPGEVATLYRRARLRPGVVVNGPALIEELSSTLYLPSGTRAVVQPDGCLLIET